MLLRYSHLAAGLTGMLVSVAMAAGLIDLVVTYELRRIEMSATFSPRFVLGDLDPGRDEPVASEDPDTKH